MRNIIGKIPANISSYMIILAMGFLSFTVLPSSAIAKNATLPDDWQTMSDWYWVKFVNEGITAKQMQFMIDNNLDPNKMLTPDVNRGPKHYSLLYAIIGTENPIALVKTLLDAGADSNLTNEVTANLPSANFPLDRAIASYKFDVALLLIEHGAIGVKDNVQVLFDDIFQEIVDHQYGLDYNIDLSKAILILDYLVAQGAHPNTKISYENGDTDHTVIPISYAFSACINDREVNETNGGNFYLDIIKLLINEKTDWDIKDIHNSYYHGKGTSTIADTLRWVEGDRYRALLHCIEVADYVKNHLKENNITIENNKLPENLTPTPY